MPCKSRTAAKPQASPTLTPARSFRDDNDPRQHQTECDALRL
jgi:hypothetical protein